jgi:(R)-2-hydroxyacyl-CoA dehydratese activating ATPase
MIMAVKSMNIIDVIAKERASELIDVGAIGIDIGSRQSKAVLIHGREIYTVITASGVDSQETAERLVGKLLKDTGILRSHIDCIVGTGYGRVAINFQGISSGIMTEITCHAMGAHFLNAGTRTIIDIGGQDCKAIKIDPENGRVIEFVMNDKCAAGTGRFLEKTAEMLGYQLEELGKRALESKKKLEISSQCVVFAESEIISLKANGEKREDIAAGIHFATARRVRNMVNRIGLDPEMVFSGGVSNNPGMKLALEELLKHPIKSTKLDMVYCGALGAAVLAQRMFRDSYITGESKEDGNEN